jgi:hypothetical protein
LVPNRHRPRKLLPPSRLYAFNPRSPSGAAPEKKLARLLLYGRRERKKRSRTVQNQPLKGNIMNVHKHMEVIFVVTLAAVGAGSYALDSLPDAEARESASAPVMRAVVVPGAMPVVLVRAPKAPGRA